jgi:hypothetical protein
MHFGLIAVKGPLGPFRSAFSQIWPELEVVAAAEGFASADEIWAWTQEQPDSEVYIFCQDDPWAVLLDSSYIVASDQRALQQLSARFGSVLSFIVESTGGCAYFWSYESGQLRRSIQNINGELTTSGVSLPEEADIDVERYYMEGTEQLMLAFGLLMPEYLLGNSTAVAIATVPRSRS